MTHYSHYYQGDVKIGLKKEQELAQTVTLEGWPEVKGYDFSKPFDWQEFLKAYASTGFQATELAKAIETIREMRRNRATIFFGFTSNMVSCGVRESITHLCRKRQVDVIVTTAGGVEEDIIKLFKPFVLGSFDAPGAPLFDAGVNRTGNLYIPNDRYLEFERFLNPFLERLLALQQQQHKAISTEQFCREIGLELAQHPRKEESYLHWCAAHRIPVFCPGLTDGSLGDLIYFFKKQHPEFLIDMTDDIVRITDLALNTEKGGIIALGGSLPKHHICNAFIFSQGADYAVYLTTAQEFEGSNAGANIQEAMTWGKVKTNAQHAKVVGDASILFPLVVASGAFDEQPRAG